MASERRRRSAFILTIWPQSQDDVWRGQLETARGERRYFASLMALNALLSEYGWAEIEHLPESVEGAEESVDTSLSNSTANS